MILVTQFALNITVHAVLERYMKLNNYRAKKKQ